MPIIQRLMARRDAIQAQLDQWIRRGFKGGGAVASDDATQQETADKVTEISELNQKIAEHKAKDRDA
jgi:hypothetical protein